MPSLADTGAMALSFFPKNDRPKVSGPADAALFFAPQHDALI
jgi:hypothetical protein